VLLLLLSLSLFALVSYSVLLIIFIQQFIRLLSCKCAITISVSVNSLRRSVSFTVVWRLQVHWHIGSFLWWKPL